MTNEQKSHQNPKISCKEKFCKEKFDEKYAKETKCCKIWNHCHYAGEYRGATHSMYNSKYSVPKEIPIAFLMDLTMITILAYNS